MKLETQRLTLREFQTEDSELLAPILANPQVIKFSPTGCLAVEQTRARVNSFLASYQQYGFGKWAVIYKANQQLIGYCGIAIEVIDDVDEPELGYRLDPAFWGRGLATEAAVATLQYGCEQLKLPYLLGVVEPANLASIKVLKKLGMSYVRETKFHGTIMAVYRLNNVFFV